MPVLYDWATFLREGALEVCGVTSQLLVRVPRAERRSFAAPGGERHLSAGLTVDRHPATAPAGERHLCAELSAAGVDVRPVVGAAAACGTDELQRLASAGDGLVSQDARDPVSLTESLVAHDVVKRNAEFRRGIHSCDICISELPGNECFQ